MLRMSVASLFNLALGHMLLGVVNQGLNFAPGTLDLDYGTVDESTGKSRASFLSAKPLAPKFQCASASILMSCSGFCFLQACKMVRPRNLMYDDTRMLP